MHILLIHQAYTSINEPGGTRHHELASYLAGSGHRVTIIASPVSYLTGKRGSDTEQTGSGNGLTVIRAFTFASLHRSFMHRMLSFLSFMISSFILGLKIQDVDLIWGTSPPIFQGMTALWLAKLKKVPFLFEVRDLWPSFAIAVGVLRNPILIKASVWLESYLYRKADTVVVNSPGFTGHVRQRGAREVAILPNGADVEMFDPAADGMEFRTKHSLQDKFIAMYAGAHGLSNDLNVLLEAAVLLKEEHRIVLVLLGDGKDKPVLIQKAAYLGLSNVLFLPPVPKIAMCQTLAAADTCIAILKPIPQFRTVYPNKVFDYMAAGRSVILAIDGVIAEIIESAEAGIRVEPGNPIELAKAILWSSQNQNENRRMGRSGREYVKNHFSRRLLADQLLKIVQNTVER